MNNLSETIGKRIRNYRINLKLSQEELAEKCGLHPTYIGQIERGEKNATIESINKISAGLSLPLSTLFENIDDCQDNTPNYPLIGYNLIQSVPQNTQEKLILILKAILEIS